MTVKTVKFYPEQKTDLEGTELKFRSIRDTW